MSDTSLEVEVFHGQVSPQLAQVYARVEGLPGGQEWTIAGHLRGPQCRHAKTLPTTHTFMDLGAGDSLLARATIPDPCFWSPELPALYQVSLEIRRNQQPLQNVERELGIRFFGARGNSFYWEGKRWVLRAVSNTDASKTPLAEWRNASTAMLIQDPAEELCREASREGVLLVARASRSDLAAIRQLASWASVGMIVVPDRSLLSSDARRRFPNVMLAQSIEKDSEIQNLNEASAAFIHESALSSYRSARPICPTVVVRRLQGSISVTEGRNQCDLLQRNMAPLGDFAGYVIDAKQP